MRIPHNINQSTLQVYTPSTDTTDLIGEQSRKLVSENFEWDKNQCHSLKEYCVAAIAKYFKDKPLLKELPCEDLVYLLDILPLDLPLEFIIPLIDNEHYWERRFVDAFKYNWRTKPVGWDWKTLYLERHCQKMVEEAEPQYEDEQTFDEILELCNLYVKRLFVEQLQMWKPPLTMEKEDIPEIWPIQHISFIPILKKLNNLEEFDLIFGMKNVGVDFEWNMFKVSPADCQKLGKAFQDHQNLRIIRIHRSKLEFRHCQALIQGLVGHHTVQVLDLSHCKIGDTGALCCAYLLKTGTNLKTLNLSNNDIGKIGSEGIGFAMLQGNCEMLHELNLRCNPLGTEGVMGIMRAVVRCAIPKILCIAACSFEDETAVKICQMLKLNDTLKELDISANWIGDDIGDMLVESLESNEIIEKLDVRETDISSEQLGKIQEILKRNVESALLAKLNPSGEDI
ncbi:unnamed protein product [Ceutorhynchus assimilis]|uniref:Dynein regulatory complex subunit 5 n=1 Tax=Ceutorhynchus assimilis TaxID=467358 RepID=A0A9N9MTH1_9CUCU|nr:unnamed protein product [Ceutorhynchus assimilis]